MIYESGIIIFGKASVMYYRISNQALLLALRTLSVSISDSEALLRFTDSLVVHWAFLFDAKACPHPRTALFT